MKCLAAWGVLAVLTLGSGCQQFEALEPERVCLDTAYAVSNRVFRCTDDSEQANAAFDLFQSQTRCKVASVEQEPIAAYYDCPTQVLAASCPEVTALVQSGDLTGFLDLSDKCPLILEPTTP